MVSLVTKGLYAELNHSFSVGVATFGKYIGVSVLPDGETVYIAVPVCSPEVLVEQVVQPNMQANDVDPMLPDMKVQGIDLRPKISAEV